MPFQAPPSPFATPTVRSKEATMPTRTSATILAVTSLQPRQWGTPNPPLPAFSWPPQVLQGVAPTATSSPASSQPSELKWAPESGNTRQVIGYIFGGLFCVAMLSLCYFTYRKYRLGENLLGCGGRKRHRDIEKGLVMGEKPVELSGAGKHYDRQPMQPSYDASFDHLESGSEHNCHPQSHKPLQPLLVDSVPTTPCIPAAIHPAATRMMIPQKPVRFGSTPAAIRHGSPVQERSEGYRTITDWQSRSEALPWNEIDRDIKTWASSLGYQQAYDPDRYSHMFLSSDRTSEHDG